jgi:WD40 repeat protein
MTGFGRLHHLVKFYQGHRGYVWSVSLCPGRNRIVSGSGDKTIRVWDIVSGAEVLQQCEGMGIGYNLLHSLPTDLGL